MVQRITQETVAQNKTHVELATRKKQLEHRNQTRRHTNPFLFQLVFSLGPRVLFVEKLDCKWHNLSRWAVCVLKVTADNPKRIRSSRWLYHCYWTHNNYITEAHKLISYQRSCQWNCYLANYSWTRWIVFSVFVECHSYHLPGESWPLRTGYLLG